MSIHAPCGHYSNARRTMILAVASLTMAFSVTTNAGSCTFIQENMFAGPFDACMSPIDKAGCEVLGREGSNANAVYSDGACATEKLVGTCVRESDAIAYYSGEAENLEVGCGFQGGEWK